MADTGNSEKVVASSVDQPMAESSSSSVPSAKKSTRRVLTANERLEIAQQAIVDLGLVGIESGASVIYQDGHSTVAIYLSGVKLDNGRLVAINGKEER